MLLRPPCSRTETPATYLRVGPEDPSSRAILSKYPDHREESGELVRVHRYPAEARRSKRARPREQRGPKGAAVCDKRIASGADWNASGARERAATIDSCRQAFLLSGEIPSQDLMPGHPRPMPSSRRQLSFPAARRGAECIRRPGSFLREAARVGLCGQHKMLRS